MKYTEIINQRRTILLEMEQMHKKHQRAEKRLQEKLRVLQTTCKHLHKTYYPDPSGNNDSFYECDDCGKML